MATSVLGSELVDNSCGRKQKIRAAFRNFGGRGNPNCRFGIDRRRCTVAEEMRKRAWDWEVG